MVSINRHSAILLSSALLLIAQISQAAPPGMSEQQMQQMMMQAQEAQKCFSKLDQSKFDELEAKGKKMQAEIKALCAAGKRDKATSTVMKYSKEMQNDPHLKAMRKCGELMAGSMAGMPQLNMLPTEDSQEEAGHICDDI
jgi:3'-phosphoadenosine 5'-phosphosulfate (PAPS) 3'-phosphatase